VHRNNDSANSLKMSKVTMGGIQRAGTGKNKKVTEISPC